MQYPEVDFCPSQFQADAQPAIFHIKHLHFTLQSYSHTYSSELPRLVSDMATEICQEWCALCACFVGHRCN